MNKAKDAILNRIRTGLGRGRLSADAQRSLVEGLAAPADNIVPGRVQLSGPDLIREFIRMTTGEATTVSRVESDEDVPKSVAVFLREHGLPDSVVIAPEETVSHLPWEESGIHVRPGRAEKDDLVSVTPGFAGIAETGCFMLVSGPNHPYTLNFLPENHIVVLKRNRIVPTPEEAFDLLRKEFGPGNMPRTALMVSGPSRSADIGTSLQFGAHGPRRLHCILVGEQ